jgi:hypothetical protein
MYVANFLGIPLDTVVKWFILIIVLVFDPLSISLVLAYNFLKMHKEKENSQQIIDIPLVAPLEKNIIEDSIVEEPQLILEETIIDPPVQNNIKPSLQEMFESGMPYYMDVNFDWNTDSRWMNDQSAVDFKMFLDANRR